jgi:hypothetical protein
MFTALRERRYKLGWYYYNNTYIKTYPCVLYKSSRIDNTVKNENLHIYNWQWLVFWLHLYVLLEYLNINNITEKYSDETEDECGTMCKVILKMHDVVKINV